MPNPFDPMRRYHGWRTRTSAPAAAREPITTSYPSSNQGSTFSISSMVTL